MYKLLCVGLGGFCGAICRYLISLLPYKGSFPFLTLITNLGGAILIGAVVGFATSRKGLSPNLVLFWKTGVCGGFTTFSTFSLEALQLMESEKGAYALAYVVLSILGCIAGVWAGRKLILL